MCGLTLDRRPIDRQEPFVPYLTDERPDRRYRRAMGSDPAGSSGVAIDPRYHDAVLFDLDGVITDTASFRLPDGVDTIDDWLRAIEAGSTLVPM